MAQLEVQAFLVFLALHASVAGNSFVNFLRCWSSGGFVLEWGWLLQDVRSVQKQDACLGTGQRRHLSFLRPAQVLDGWSRLVYHKDRGYVTSKESGLTRLPLSGWRRTANGVGVKDAPDLKLITKDQAQGHPWVQDIERSRRITCGRKEAPSCLDCGSTCYTDCFTWPQKWSLQKPCVSKQCKSHPCSFFKK